MMCKDEKDYILIVDDEPLIIEMMQFQLHGLGYKTLVSYCGEDAIDMFKRNNNSIKLVIGDYNLPDIFGDILYKLFKRINSDIPFVFMTGDTDKETFLRSLSHKTGYLQKPFKQRELAEIVYEYYAVSKNFKADC